MQKASIVVKVGESVLRGRNLARCGNTGNSTEPHLYFHLQNGPGFRSSVGLSIRFNSTTLRVCPRHSLMDTQPVMPPSDDVLKKFVDFQAKPAIVKLSALAGLYRTRATRYSEDVGKSSGTSPYSPLR